jgi:polysaccharide biosynthesis/export protein
MHTTHRSVRLTLAALAVLMAAVRPGSAQQATVPGLQQQGGFTTVQPGANRNPNAAANVLRNSELTVVPPDFALLKLAPGFLISLEVLDDPDFEGDFRVDQSGDVALPILGSIHVAGETSSEARLQIRQQLIDGQILKDPQVNLTVVEYSAPEVTILGEVGTPGRYPLLAPRSLSDVIALAGGLSITAGNTIEITHSDKNAEPEIVHYSKDSSTRVAQDVMVQPGDTVRVKRAGIVYVLGGVTRPGGYVMQEDGRLTVLEAVSMANGTVLAASVKTIYLVRRNPDGTAVRLSLPLGKMQRGKDSDLELHATDVVYVPMSRLKSVLISAQGVLAAAASASIYVAASY